MKKADKPERREKNGFTLKKLLALAVLAVGTGAALYLGVVSNWLAGMEPIPENALISKKTVNLWYTDEALSDYLASAALDFSDQSSVRIIPRLVSGLEYLENINRESLDSDSCPDLYIISNDSLEKAALAGLAEPVTDGWVSAENYPETALSAVTWQGKVMGYPYYYETSALIYNRTYLEEFARSILEAQADAQAGEEAMAALDENGGMPAQTEEDGQSEDGQTPAEGASPSGEEALPAAQEVTEEYLASLIPSNISEILTLADNYDAPEQVEAVFKWDVSDIFYNYFFVGNYIDVGGPCGDDTQQIDIYNLDAIRCMQAYQEMNQFFSIDTGEVDYESVVQEFLDGKLLFTVGTTDILSRIDQAAREGSFDSAFGVTCVPDIDGELKTRSLSVTNVIVINGYSENQEAAAEFAKYLACADGQELYERTGKLSAYRKAEYDFPQAQAFFGEYENSVPIPKMMAASNYWVQMEIAFTRIWSGEEVSAVLKELSEQIMTQVNGEVYTEEYIVPPVKETEEENTEETAEETTGETGGETAEKEE